MLTQIINEINQQHEIMLESMLLNHGFNRDYILQHSGEFHCDDVGNVKIYFHNNKEIFREVTTYDDKNYKVITEFIDH